MKAKSKINSRRTAGSDSVSFDPAGALKVRSWGRFPMRPEFSTRIYRHATIAFHQHDYSCTVRIGKNKFAVKPGDVTLTPSHTVSCYEFESRTVGRADQPLPTVSYPVPRHQQPAAVSRIKILQRTPKDCITIRIVDR